jgi:hypothetical protein
MKPIALQNRNPWADDSEQTQEMKNLYAKAAFMRAIPYK